MFNPDEAKTRKELIDPALGKAGWDVNNPNLVGLEIPVDGFDPQVWANLKVKLNRIKESGGTPVLNRNASPVPRASRMVSSAAAKSE